MFSGKDLFTSLWVPFSPSFDSLLFSKHHFFSSVFFWPFLQGPLTPSTTQQKYCQGWFREMWSYPEMRWPFCTASHSSFQVGSWCLMSPQAQDGRQGLWASTTHVYLLCLLLGRKKNLQGTSWSQRTSQGFSSACSHCPACSLSWQITQYMLETSWSSPNAAQSNWRCLFRHFRKGKGDGLWTLTIKSKHKLRQWLFEQNRTNSLSSTLVDV